MKKATFFFECFLFVLKSFALSCALSHFFCCEFSLITVWVVYLLKIEQTAPNGTSECIIVVCGNLYDVQIRDSANNYSVFLYQCVTFQIDSYYHLFEMIQTKANFVLAKTNLVECQQAKEIAKICIRRSVIICGPMLNIYNIIKFEKKRKNKN